jgi:hypothetical protein
MKDEKKYTFNSEAILVDAKTGSKENWQTTAKIRRNLITLKKLQAMFGNFLVYAIAVVCVSTNVLQCKWKSRFWKTSDGGEEL